MTTNTHHLLGTRRFLPLFVTQCLNAFNDNLFKTAIILFATYHLYTDPAAEAKFSAIATGLFILPYFLLSATSGQLADMRDKAQIIRIVKSAEIAIMAVGAVGFFISSVWILLVAIFAMGVHSAFFGTIKYAILPQHLRQDEVLGGTGLVEAGTYLAIVAGTVAAGFIANDPFKVMIAILGVAILGCIAGFQVPSAPSLAARQPIDWHLWRASSHLIRTTMQIPSLFMAIIAISFFWTIGTVLVIIFPPLTKNILGAGEAVASLMLGIFSVGVALGSLIINRLLKNQVSARYTSLSAIMMGGFVGFLYWVASHWQITPGPLLDVAGFFAHADSWKLSLALIGIATTGGMFVVPLYAFLTTSVPTSETARTVAANNIVNAGAMVIGSLATFGLSALGLDAAELLAIVAVQCLIAAWLGAKLYAAEKAHR